MKKIFVTGGHFAPAKAVIQELLRRGGWEIFYLGRKYSMEGSNLEALEYSEIGNLPGVHYLTITTGRLQRQFFVNFGQSLIAFLKIFIGLGQSLFWLLQYRPKVILSFGGYVAVPIVFWGWLFGIPIVTHEQTTVSGRANRFISFLADQVLVSWPGQKGILTGNPIREEVLKQKVVTSQRPVIYFTGGSQGAKILDEVAAKIIPKLARKYQVISGRLSGEKSAKVLARANLVVGRAGANTVTEILYFGIPAILIPLPHAHGNEQEKNAQLVVNSGLGKIILQKDLTPTKLLILIEKMIKYKRKPTNLVFPDAAKKIVDIVEKTS